MIRYLVAFLVCLALQFAPGSPAIGQAQAAVGPDGVSYSCLSSSYNAKPTGCTAAMAFEQCSAVANWFKTPAGGNKTGAYCKLYDVIYSGTWNSYRVRDASGYLYASYFNGFISCPAGETWDAASNTCFSSAKCLAKPALGNTKVSNASAPYDSVCSEACEFTQGSGVDVQIPNGDGTWYGLTTGWKPSGNACPSGAPSPSPFTSAQDCKPAPDGQTFCIKPNGEHCYSLTNGSGGQVCWRGGETGEKSSANALQVRNGGSSPAAPATPPPSGDSFSQGGGPITTTTIVNGTTIVTTTTNYITNNGTNVGSTDSGEPGDGSGQPPSGGGEGEEGSASGGAGCDAPPVCSGDPINCALLEQVWRNRCSGNGNKASDAGCGEDGGVLAFTCSGDEIMCKQALIAKEDQCRGIKREGAIAADAAEGDGEDGFDLAGLWKSGTGQELDDDLIQLQAAELFPEVELAPGQVFGTPEGLADLLAKIRLIIVAGFMIAAAWIAGGVS